MQHQTKHTTHVPLGFEEVCARLDRADQISVGPSSVAVLHIERSARSAGLIGFDRSASVDLHLGKLDRVTEDFARISLVWKSGADDQRLLPHVDAELLIHAVIAKGPHASTAMSVAGRFTPSGGVRRHIEDLLFGRRIVDEAMQRFLASLARNIIDEPIDLRTNDGDRSTV